MKELYIMICLITLFISLVGVAIYLIVKVNKNQKMSEIKYNIEHIIIRASENKLTNYPTDYILEIRDSIKTALNTYDFKYEDLEAFYKTLSVQFDICMIDKSDEHVMTMDKIILGVWNGIMNIMKEQYFKDCAFTAMAANTLDTVYTNKCGEEYYA